MRRLTIAPANIGSVVPNVFIGEIAEAYYDKNAKKSEMLVLLPGTLITNNHDKDGWIHDNIDELERKGYLQSITNGYRVLKPIWGTPSGTAAMVLGKNGPKKPSGYKLWKFANAKSIEAAKEKPTD